MKKSDEFGRNLVKPTFLKSLTFFSDIQRTTWLAKLPQSSFDLLIIGGGKITSSVISSSPSKIYLIYINYLFLTGSYLKFASLPKCI